MRARAVREGTACGRRQSIASSHWRQRSPPRIASSNGLRWRSSSTRSAVRRPVGARTSSLPSSCRTDAPAFCSRVRRQRRSQPTSSSASRPHPSIRPQSSVRAASGAPDPSDHPYPDGCGFGGIRCAIWASDGWTDRSPFAGSVASAGGRYRARRRRRSHAVAARLLSESWRSDLELLEQAAQGLAGERLAALAHSAQGRSSRAALPSNLLVASHSGAGPSRKSPQVREQQHAEVSLSVPPDSLRAASRARLGHSPPAASAMASSGRQLSAARSCSPGGRRVGAREARSRCRRPSAAACAPGRAAARGSARPAARRLSPGILRRSSTTTERSSIVPCWPPMPAIAIGHQVENRRGSKSPPTSTIRIT